MDKYYVDNIFNIIDDKILEQREKLISGCIASMEGYRYEYGRLNVLSEIREEIRNLFKVNKE